LQLCALPKHPPIEVSVQNNGARQGRALIDRREDGLPRLQTALPEIQRWRQETVKAGGFSPPPKGASSAIEVTIS
jgi:hypothetical protein